jgi:hypothetical protein
MWLMVGASRGRFALALLVRVGEPFAKAAADYATSAIDESHRRGQNWRRLIALKFVHHLAWAGF